MTADKLYRKCQTCPGSGRIARHQQCPDCDVGFVPADQPEAFSVEEIEATIKKRHGTDSPSFVADLRANRRAAEGVWVEPGDDVQVDGSTAIVLGRNHPPGEIIVWNGSRIRVVPYSEVIRHPSRSVLGVRKPLTYRQVIEQALRRWTATKAQDKYMLAWADEQDRKRQGGQ